MPFIVLCSLVLVLCIVDGYAHCQKMHDMGHITGFGIAGYLMRKADYPMAHLVLTLAHGPLMEKSFRQKFIVKQGNILAFVERPLSDTFFALSLVFFLLPLPKYAKKSSRARKASIEPAE